MSIWKVLLSVLIVGVFASVAFASAARLNLNSQGVQAGVAVIRGCQGDAALDISYGTHYENTISAFLVDGVTIGGISDACVSPLPLCAHTMHVVLTFSGGASQNLGVVCINSNPVVLNIPAGSQPSATDLTDVHVLIK